MRALRECLAQARRHFTRFDQVDRLARAARSNLSCIRRQVHKHRTNPGEYLSW